MRCLYAVVRLRLMSPLGWGRKCLASSFSSAVLPENHDVSTPMPWRLSAAICVERIPTLVPELSPIQKQMLDNLRRIEQDNSLKSDHELRQVADMDRARRRREGDETLQAGIRTAEDDEDDWKKDLESFQPVPRNTEADQSNDVRSIRRTLDRPLHLVVERKVGQELHWDLPTTANCENETMRQTAEKALARHCGNQLKVSVLGNSPWAFYKYSYSKKIREQTGRRGEKVFIYKAIFVDGLVAVDQDACNDFKWVLREELWDLLDRPTRNALFEILYDEE